MNTIYILLFKQLVGVVVVDLSASTGDWTALNRLTSFKAAARKTSYQADERKTSWDPRDRD